MNSSIKLCLALFLIGSTLLSVEAILSPNNSDDGIQGRIAHDKPVGASEFIKHHLYIFTKATYLCGATLVNAGTGPLVAITTAHCLWLGYPTFESYRLVHTVHVYAGHNKLSDKTHEQHSEAQEIVAHPDFDPLTFANDIAIIFLDTPFTENDKVSAIGLPDRDTRLTDTVKIAGYGGSFYGGPIHDELGWEQEPVMDPKDCASIGEKSDIFETDTVVQFCVGESGKIRDIGMCSGDEGGGATAVDDISNKEYLAGVISYRTDLRCGSPAVYTKVAEYSDWIKSEVEKYGGHAHGKKE